MKEMDLSDFQNYQSDIETLINTFTSSKEMPSNRMKNLEYYLKNDLAMAAGHIIDNQLISFVWCHKRKFGGTFRLHISYFVVNKNHRGRGLSKELLLYVKKKAIENNITKIDLNVNPDNEGAIKVYEKSGFITEKIQLVYNVEGDDYDV